MYNQSDANKFFLLAALSSYGGFWISFGILLTPAFGIVESYTNKTTGVSNFNEVFALYLWGWFIFTTLCMLLTTRSTVAFFSLFAVLDAAFLCLALSEQYAATAASPHLQTAGGVFGILAAFLAWFNMFAGMADSSNFWFNVPVIHLPWSDKKRQERADERV